MQRKLEYINEGRSGYVIYSDETTKFRLYYEFGGGECAAIINITPAEDWIKVTGCPLTSRNDILAFIAGQAVRDQTSKGHFKISDKFIEIYE